MSVQQPQNLEELQQRLEAAIEVVANVMGQEEANALGEFFIAAFDYRLHATLDLMKEILDA